MAFGDLLQSDESNFPGSSPQATFPATPTSGNLLVWGVCGSSGGATITPPTGFTELEYVTSVGAIVGWMGYKISAGDESSAISGSLSGGTGKAWVIELDMASETLDTVSSDLDTTEINDTTSGSVSSGSVTPSGSKNIVVACMHSQVTDNLDGGASWTNSFSGLVGFTAATGAGVAFASVSDVTGSQSTTYSHTDTGDNRMGMIAAFNMVAASSGGALPLINAYYS